MKYAKNSAARLATLVTGTGSGLGRYLVKALSGESFDHHHLESQLSYHYRENYDLIVHCGFDTRSSLCAKELYNYYTLNIKLVESLLQIKHRYFVFISSVAVYPPESNICMEDDDIYLNGNISLYGFSKLVVEQIVKTKADISLILRPVSIVGPEARPNNIMKVLMGEDAQLTVRHNSRYNLVTQEQIARFIQFAYHRGVNGIYNVGAVDTATIEEIAKMVGCCPCFGDHFYQVPYVSTQKIRNVCSLFNEGTLEIAKQLNSFYHNRK